MSFRPNVELLYNICIDIYKQYLSKILSPLFFNNLPNRKAQFMGLAGSVTSFQESSFGLQLPVVFLSQYLLSDISLVSLEPFNCLS